MNLSTIEEATTLRKAASTFAAMALASNVFPVPGGPYSRTPLGGSIPTRMKSYGLVKGNSITSRSWRICSCKPPMSWKEVYLPSFTYCIVYTCGSTPRGRILTIVKVLMSSATRVPNFRFSGLMLFLKPTKWRAPLLLFTMYFSASTRRSISPT